MSTTYCSHCGTKIIWDWQDAFDKFGFDDGDGLVMTNAVANVLRTAGYTVTAEPWRLHNVVITSIQRDGGELIPETANIGYDEPRKYLPVGIVALLDEKLSGAVEVQP